MKTPAAAQPQTGQQAVTLDVSVHGRDEMNLAEFPITVLADRAPKGAKTLIFRASQGQLTITGSDAFGLPTALDADVIVALIQLTKLKTDFKNPKVHFTRYELLRLLGWNNEGRNYRRLDESLQRWVGVTLHYDNCWWDNRAKRYGDATLHILESAIILDGKGQSDEEGSQQLLPLSSFTWNRVFLNSCQADNLKLLDVGMYFSLEHSAAKRLYRFLDKRFYKGPHWVFDLAEIAFERVGLSRNYARNVAKIKEKLQPAVEELEDIGFLEPLRRDDRYFKDAGGWKIRLSKRQPDKAPLPRRAGRARCPTWSASWSSAASARPRPRSFSPATRRRACARKSTSSTGWRATPTGGSTEIPAAGSARPSRTTTRRPRAMRTPPPARSATGHARRSSAARPRPAGQGASSSATPSRNAGPSTPISPGSHRRPERHWKPRPSPGHRKMPGRAASMPPRPGSARRFSCKSCATTWRRS